MPSRYVQIISGERRGVIATTARTAARCASWIYAGMIGFRNGYYDRWAFPIWLDVPVLSVGNLTVGGTGKTPMTLWLCERLLERGHKPAILSRGYKASSSGPGDELLMVSRRCPHAVAVANPDRAAAGMLATQEYGATVAVLDDGFQHRRLGRDLDMVLIDATRPFGYDHLLPRGLLREPVKSLRRADAVVITRSDQCDPARLNDIRAKIRGVSPEIPVVTAVHAPSGFVDLAGRPLGRPDTGRMGCFAGIARPESLLRTLNAMGLSAEAVQWWPDHHPYTLEDVEKMSEWAKRHRLDVLVTTEKDAVKLTELDADWPLPVSVLRVDIQLRDDGQQVIGDLIDHVLQEHEQDQGEGMLLSPETRPD